MAYTQYRIAVPEAFAAVFSHFYYAHNNSTTAITHTLLPAYQTMMVFSFGACIALVSQAQTRIEVEQCVVMVPVKQAFQYTLEPGAIMLVANFKDDAFFRFFGLAALPQDMPVAPDSLLSDNCFAGLWVTLQQLDTPELQVQTLLDFCAPYLRAQHDTSRRIAGFDTAAQSPVKALARDLQQSERSLQLHHKQYFGYTAKEKMRYQRFIQAVNYLRDHPGNSDWFELVHRFGYYDQSQLIHDFKHYLRLSPGKYLKFQQDICRAGD